MDLHQIENRSQIVSHKLFKLCLLPTGAFTRDSGGGESEGGAAAGAHHLNHDQDYNHDQNNHDGGVFDDGVYDDGVHDDCVFDDGESKFDERISGPRAMSGGEQRKSHEGYYCNFLISLIYYTMNKS